ncbi:MAG: hypothetical protein LBR28_03495 [Bacteroidales bacterium]|nr:hypothetical protein [Bacteroidales bacterium]
MATASDTPDIISINPVSDTTEQANPSQAKNLYQNRRLYLLSINLNDPLLVRHFCNF